MILYRLVNLKKNIYFTKYNIYKKKSNKKVGEGYIASVDEVIKNKNLYQCYVSENVISIDAYDVSYITYIKVHNPDDNTEH